MFAQVNNPRGKVWENQFNFSFKFLFTFKFTASYTHTVFNVSKRAVYSELEYIVVIVLAIN